MPKLIKVLVKEPFKEIEVKEINNNLKSLQEVVVGYIECVPFPRLEEVDLVVIEEVKMARMEGNFLLPNYDDCIVGTAIVVSYNKEGEFVSLSEQQIKKAKDYINNFKLEKGQDIYEQYDALNLKEKIKLNNLQEQM